MISPERISPKVLYFPTIYSIFVLYPLHIITSKKYINRLLVKEIFFSKLCLLFYKIL